MAFSEKIRRQKECSIRHGSAFGHGCADKRQGCNRRAFGKSVQQVETAQGAYRRQHGNGSASVF